MRNRASTIDLDADWHPDVYHGAEYNVEAWRCLQNQIINRDGQRCVMCKDTHALSAHHILPRDKGGTDATCNLVTLCRECHDIKELGYSVVDKDIYHKPPQATVTTDWHTWVYGGQRNPIKA
jgi:5-methylcytosine-specific restriction endonuclease McrA